MNRNILWGTFAVGLLAILAGIMLQEEAGDWDSIQHQFSPSQIITSSAIADTNTNMSQLVKASNRLGFELFEQIQRAENQTKNVFISPSSVAIALAMMRNGTAGETLTEMNHVLGLDREAETINPSYAKLLETWQSTDADVQLAIANSVWVNQDISLKEQFVNQAQDFYQAEVTKLNFTDAAKDTINNWVRKNTANKIPQIVDSLSPQDALYLINAIYFKGSWSNKFDPDTTGEQPFYLNDGQSKDVAMMSQNGDYRYFEHEQFQAIRLPYGEGEMSMYVFLPQENSSLEEFNRELNSDNWQQWLTAMRSRQGNVTLPKFKLEFEIELNNALASLGMKRIFNPAAADFSAMTDSPVAIDTVKHKAAIEVSEEGTEAAAVTSIGVRITSAMPKDSPFEMNINRPFFLAICDDLTETILFMGNVVEPISL